MLLNAYYRCIVRADTALEAPVNDRATPVPDSIEHTLLETWLMDRFLSLRLLENVPLLERVNAFYILAAKYGEGHRRYHVLLHISFCLEMFDLFRHLAKNPDAVELAIFYHDFFYDIGVPSRQNEEKSALLLVQHMTEWGCRFDDLYNTMSAVLATTHDHKLHTDDNRLIVDIDLAGLGQPWEVFLENNRNVREEYKDVPEDKFREGNGEVLRRFYEKTPLYHHPEIEAAYGAQAKENLQRWLNRP
jgi:predicted metal-dependent HD superfamily phosphohydrolase